MGFNLPKTFRLGPFYVRTNNGRVTSWGIKLGRFTYNVTRRRVTVDTPGPGSWNHTFR